MPDDSLYLLSAGSALLIGLFAFYSLMPIAKRFGLVDAPGGRKHHARETPLIGGAVIFLGLCGTLLFLPIPTQLYRGMLVGSIILFIVALVDDFYPLRPKYRFIAQALATLSLVFIGHVSLNYVGGIFFVPALYLNGLALPMTFLLVMSFINAINMIDGQDGLAGSIVFTESILLFGISVCLKLPALSILLFVFMVLLLLFLAFNVRLPWRKHARIFLGDSGSTFLAFFIAWAVTLMSQVEASPIQPITFLWIVSFPMFDMTSACFTRKRKGRSWFKPSHDHIHHILQRQNVSLLWSGIVLSLASLGFGLFGLLLHWLQVADRWQFLMFLMAHAGYVLFVRKLSGEDIGELPYDEGNLQPDG